MTVIRQLKRRFGIAAPRVAVHTHAPWYLRWGLIFAGIGVMLAVAWITYDVGRNLAGFQSSKAAAEQARLSEEVAHLRDENAELRSQLAAMEGRMQIERATHGNLASQMKTLTDENALIKEDLAFFQTLMTSSGDAPGGISINRFRVRADALPGEYRYQLLVVQSRTRSREFQGKLRSSGSGAGRPAHRCWCCPGRARKRNLTASASSSTTGSRAFSTSRPTQRSSACRCGCSKMAPKRPNHHRQSIFPRRVRMFGGKASKPQTRIDSLIGDGTTVEGNVIFNGGLRIDGRVKGNVLAGEEQPSTLVLSERARVEGEIRVSHAVVNGTVVGPVHATEYVELQPKCNVTGDVHYRTLEIQLGAVVQGRLVHQEEAQAPKVLTVKAATGD